jgi:hypothetical protein
MYRAFVVASVIGCVVMCSGCVSLFPEKWTIRVPNGYRGPIAILPAKVPGGKAQSYQWDITIPANGMFLCPTGKYMSEYYTLDVVYESGDRILTEDLGASIAVVAYRCQVEGSFNDGPVFYYAFIGTGKECADFDWERWGTLVNEYYNSNPSP